MTTIEFVGAYAIAPTEGSVAEAARYHGYPWDEYDARNFRMQLGQGRLHVLVLVELDIKGELPPDVVGTIRLGEDEPSPSDQVPYLEFCLDESGTRLLDDEEAVHLLQRRLCFFLHNSGAGRTLHVGNLTLTLPAPTELPLRLTPFAQYLPVD